VRKWMILAAVAALVAVFLVQRGGQEQGNRPVRKDRPAELDPSPGALEVGEGTTPAVLGTIYGTVWRSGRPTAARVELRFLRATDPSLPSCLRTMPPPAFCLESPFSDREPERDVATDPQGRFSIPDVPNGSYEVRAVCDDGLTGSVTAHLNRRGQRVRADPEVADGVHALRGLAQFQDGSAFEGWVSVVVKEEWLGSWTIMDDALLVFQPPLAGRAAKTDSEGRFSISGLRRGAHLVSCLREGAFRSVGRWVTVPRDEEYLFVVDRGLVGLAGQVLAEDSGEPVPGATVWAAGNPTGGLHALARARADEDGRFSLRVPSERRGVLADADGFRPSSFPVPDGDEQVTVRLARAAKAHGTVVEKQTGRPVRGITVFAVPRQEDWADQILPVGHTVSDARGRFAFTDLPPGMLSLGARGNGWVSPDFGALGGESFDPSALSLSPGSEADLRLEVVRPARVHGTVVDEEGSPVPDAVLRVVHAGQSAWRSQVRHLLVSTCTAGPDGRFDLPELVPGLKGDLVVSAPGYAEIRLPVPPIASGDSREIEVRLTGGLFAEVGVVEEETGKPLQGVSVEAGRLDWLHPEVHVHGVRTDSEGRARLGPLPPRRLKLLVDLEGYAPVERSTEFEPPASLTVEMKKTGGELEIAGTVHFEDGTVPYRAAVSASGPDDVSRERVPVDDLGRFRLAGLPRGEYSVRAVAFREQWFEVETEVEAGASGVDLVLGPQEPWEGTGGEPTRFRVLTPDGRPVARGDLVVHHRGQHRWVTNRNYIRDGTATCIGPDTKESFWVDVYKARSRSGARLEAGGALIGPVPEGRREMEIRLPTERRITGCVRDENGTPVPGARVFAEPVYPFDIHRPLGPNYPDGPRTHSETFAGREGGFELRWLGDLEYVVKVDVPPEFLDAKPATVRAGTRDVVLVLTRGGEQRITVLDEQGAPVARASIELLSLQRNSWYPYRDGAYADDRGVAVLSGLDLDQKYLVRVNPPDDRPALLDLEIEDWEPRDSTVELKTGLFVKGVVRDSDGVPTGEAVVCTHGDRVDVAADGTFSIGPFQPGRVRVIALPPGARSWGATERWKEVEAGTEGVGLVLHTRWELRVRVEGAEGAEVWEFDARLTLDRQIPHEQDFGGWTRRPRWREGQIVFPDLDAGKSYSLYVGHPELGLFDLRHGITRNTPTIVARLERGRTIRGRLLLPADPPSHGVTAEGPGFEVEGKVARDGTFEIRGVPPGACTVCAWTRTGFSERRTYEHDVAGEPVIIDIRHR